MGKLYDLARMTTATVGTGTVTLGAAVSGFLTFALAGVQNGDVVSYGIKDGANSEVGTGTYTAAGTTLTRTPTKSTNGNALISLSGAAEVYITMRAEDFPVAGAGITLTGPTIALDTNNALGVGSIIMAQCGTNCAAGTTVIAAYVVPVYWDSSGVIHTSGTTTGTWRNISGAGLTATQTALFQRVS